MPDAPRQLRVCTYYRRIIVENFVDRRETTTSYFVAFFRKIFPKFTKWDTSKYPSCSLYRDNLRNESRIIFDLKNQDRVNKEEGRKERKRRLIENKQNCDRGDACIVNQTRSRVVYDKRTRKAAILTSGFFHPSVLNSQWRSFALMVFKAIFFFFFFFIAIYTPPVKLSVEITLYFPHRWTTLLSTRDNARSTPSVSNSVQGLLKRRRRKNSLRRSSPLFIHLQTFADYFALRRPLLL